MDILTGITTALSTLKTGFEIKKLAGNLDSDIQQGELRVEIRKLQESLLDVQEVLLKAKQEILDDRNTIEEKDDKIAELEDLLKFNKTTVRNNDKYFEVDEKGLPTNDPFCSRCWDSEQKKIYLISPQKGNNNYQKCPQCKITYGKRDKSGDYKNETTSFYTF